MKSVVIVGCPFSGTKYIAEVLNLCGIAVGHEKVEEQGIVSWKHTRWSRDDFIKNGVKEPLVILHQVKHPIMAISSIMALLSAGDWRWLGDYAETHDLPHLMRDRNLLERSMGLWYCWNQMAEELALFSYSIEALEWSWETILDSIGVACVDIPSVGVRYNRHKKRPIISWNQMYKCCPELAANILNLAYDYEYVQFPVEYMGDSHYEFPEDLVLSVEDIERCTFL